MSDCFIFYSHIVDRSSVRSIVDICDALGTRFEIVWLSASNKMPDKEIIKALRIPVFNVNFEQLKQLPYNKVQGFDGSSLVGFGDLPVLAYFQQSRQFRNYWICEYDVRYSGRWSDLLTALELSNADLLCAHVEKFTANPNWQHWKNLRIRGEPVLDDHKLKGFLPFSRMSNNLLRAIDFEYRHGCIGHPEVTWPTIAVLNEFSVEEIGGNGALTPLERQGRYYSTFYIRPGFLGGTFVAWPPLGLPSYEDIYKGPPDLLWHPVKA